MLHNHETPLLHHAAVCLLVIEQQIGCQQSRFAHSAMLCLAVLQGRRNFHGKHFQHQQPFAVVTLPPRNSDPFKDPTSADGHDETCTRIGNMRWPKHSHCRGLAMKLKRHLTIKTKHLSMSQLC